MGGEWKVQSCSSESPVHKADNVVREELYRIWQTEEPSEEAWLVLETDPPKPIERVEIVNAGASLIELYGLPEDRSEEELLLSTQQVMTLKDLTNKTNRTRSFTYTIPQKLSPIAAEKRWKQLRIICHQPFGTKEHRACIGLSRIDVISCNTEANSLQPIGETSMPQEVRKLKECSTDKQPGVNSSDSSVTCSTNERLIDYKNGKGDVKKRKLPVWNVTTKNSAEDSNGFSGGDAGPSEERKIKQISENSEGNAKNATGDHTGKGARIESKDNILSRDSKINSSSPKTTVQEKKQKISSNMKDPTSNVIAASSSHGPILSGSSEVDKKEDRSQSKPDRGSFSALLDGVVFAMSGLVNPERGNLRSQGLQMGAEYQPDWNSNCTLLACAFPNTPKFMQVKGDGGTIVSKGKAGSDLASGHCKWYRSMILQPCREWISECYKKRKLVDIDPYLMHVGKPWRKLQPVNVSPVSPINEPDQMKKKPPLHGKTISARINKKAKGMGEISSEKPDINPSEVQKWVVEDFNATVSWLENLPEKVEGIVEKKTGEILKHKSRKDRKRSWKLEDKRCRSARLEPSIGKRAAEQEAKVHHQD
ncbi:uncharacterized protein LOC131069288 [Cryptomeria japonica]|uniref:uncharacterized protein LOC131069288 n=1 Tax=Cryptomeria japonica TaxID=3369 RepID=UPI0027DAA5F4|nr:uncharacterized protein LOC131069288 [Cryptomeria japonica]